MFNNSVADMFNVTAPVSAPPLNSGGIQGYGGNASKDLPVGPVSYHITFVNTMSTSITVVDRHGFRIQVPPTPAPQQKPRFIIRLRIEATQAAWPTIENLFSGLPDGKYELLHQCREYWENMRGMTGFRLPGQSPTKHFTLDFEIEPAVLFDRPSIYVRQMDMVVSKMEPMAAPPHPMHPDAAHLVPPTDDGKTSTSNANIQFEIIEGESPLAARYIAISSKVFRIDPKKDNRREPGLYLTYLERDPSDTSRMRTVQDKYPLDAMETAFNIYRSPEEAMAAGDVKTVRKERLAELEHETTLAQRELTDFKIRAEREKEEAAAAWRLKEHEFREKEHDNKVTLQLLEGKLRDMETHNRAANAQFEREKHTLAMEAMKAKEAAEKTRSTMEERMLELKSMYEERLNQRKDFYDNRARHRDDSSAWVKFLPTIIVAIGAVVLAVFKFFGA